MRLRHPSWGQFRMIDGLSVGRARKKSWLPRDKGVAREKVNYKLRDLGCSLPRYGRAIRHSLPPVRTVRPGERTAAQAAEVASYSARPASRRGLIDEWVNVPCPAGWSGQAGTDTMPQGRVLLGTPRYTDPSCDTRCSGRRWITGCCRLYYGGMEHTTLLLLYSRFWHMFFTISGVSPRPSRTRSATATA